MHLILVAVLLVLAGNWPVSDPEIVEGFDPPSVDWQAGHRGLDLRAATGDPVYAIAAGRVAFVGSVGGKPVVTVAHLGTPGLRSTYEPVVATVHAGDLVGAGTLLGTVAEAGGHCGGTEHCVHVGLRTATTYLDPRLLIGRRPPILKPPG